MTLTSARIIYDDTSDIHNPGWFVRFGGLDVEMTLTDPDADAVDLRTAALAVIEFAGHACPKRCMTIER